MMHARLVGECDGPVAAFMQDLKQRSLLNETLVIWDGEFGRMPTVELPRSLLNTSTDKGRDHNYQGFRIWLAGGGIKGGQVYAATDAFRCQTTQNRVPVHDFRATILHLLGFDHEQFTFRHTGRDFRLTDVYGNVIHDVAY